MKKAATKPEPTRQEICSKCIGLLEGMYVQLSNATQISDLQERIETLLKLGEKDLPPDQRKTLENFKLWTERTKEGLKQFRIKLEDVRVSVWGMK